METFIAIYIFMLAAFTGFEVISKVPAILHTPLMSGSNFIHGVVLVGAIIALGMAETNLENTKMTVQSYTFGFRLESIFHGNDIHKSTNKELSKNVGAQNLGA